MNNTIKVAAGHYVDLLNPDPGAIDIRSIAAALSKICRFGGHCKQFYSVAEHSILGCKLAKEDGHGSDFLKTFLLHDAAEAYLGDVVKPLKVNLADYQRVEANFENVVARAFGVNFTKNHSEIKKYDLQMLKLEKLHLFKDKHDEWDRLKNVENRSILINYWSPYQAEHEFLGMWNKL